MFEKRGLFKSQGKNLLQNLAKKIGLSAYGGVFRKDKNEVSIWVTETWMRENFKDRVKEWFPWKNGNLIVKIEDDIGVDGYDKAKLVNTMPSHFVSYILSHNKRLMNEVIKQRGGFKILVFTTQIPILCIYTKNTGLPDLITKSLVNLLA